VSQLTRAHSPIKPLGHDSGHHEVLDADKMAVCRMKTGFRSGEQSPGLPPIVAHPPGISASMPVAHPVPRLSGPPGCCGKEVACNQTDRSAKARPVRSARCVRDSNVKYRNRCAESWQVTIPRSNYRARSCPRSMTAGRHRWLKVFDREAGRVAPKRLLLHGFPSASHMFGELIPALSDRFVIGAPDSRGSSDRRSRNGAENRHVAHVTAMTSVQ
jgi:hypothetical protein